VFTAFPLLLQREARGGQARCAGSQEFRLTNRRDYVDALGKPFWDDANRWLRSQYDLSQTWVVINGDQAGWIGEGVQWFPQALYQVDWFHAKRDIRSALRGQGQRLQAALEALEGNEIEKLERILSVAWQEAGQDSFQRELVDGLLQDSRRRPEAWVDYRVRLAEHQVATECCRGMGSAEAAVERYSARLRKVGRSWSRRGLAGLVEAMAAAFTGLQRLVNAAHTTTEDTGLADLAADVEEECHRPHRRRPYRGGAWQGTPGPLPCTQPDQTSCSNCPFPFPGSKFPIVHMCAQSSRAGLTQ